MSFFARRLSSHDVGAIVPLLRESHSFSSDDEAQKAFLHELSRGREYRGVHESSKLLGIMGWEDRGLPKHGVVEIVRFSMPESSFFRPAAELLFDTSLASIDYFFRKQQATLRKVFMVIAHNRRQAREFLEDRGLVEEGTLQRHYHDNRNELVYSLFR